LHLIAREGDLLEVAPGDFRTIKDFGNSGSLYGFYGDTGNSDGRPSGFNNLGQLAFQATFTDGTSGIFVSNRVAIPEPSTLLLLGFGSLAALWRRRGLVCASVLAAFVCAATSPARADIFQWEYINPADPSQGKQESTTLVPDGAGVDAVPGANLSNRNLTMAFLDSKDLTNVNLRQANITNVDFSYATITGADFTDAFGHGAQFFAIQGGSGAQLYSTAGYKARDLTGINLGGNDLTGLDLVGQNLTNAAFANATLTDVNFSGAVVRGASFYRDGNGGGSGINAGQLSSTASYQAHDLTGINLVGNYLAGANLSGQNLTDADLTGVTLSRANLNQANLDGANVTGANFNRVFDTFVSCFVAICTVTPVGNGGITPAQLSATANYRAHDLNGINFGGNNFTNANLTDQNLAGVNLSYAHLAGANLAGAEIRGAHFGRYSITVEVPLCSNFHPCTGDTGIIGTGISVEQLYSTASYLAHDLNGINFDGNNLAGANLAGQNLMNASFSRDFLYSSAPGANLTNADLSHANLTNANFSGATLSGANLSGADARGASGLGGLGSPNLIRPDGHVDGLDLNTGQMLPVRDYDGNFSGAVPITVDQHFAMGPGGTLRMILEADAWDSTIFFAPAILVTLDGTLELLFAEGTILASQVGRTFDLFDWTGVAPTGAFTVSSPYTWDLSNLYTTGDVTLISVPEPNGTFLLCAGLVAAWMARRKRPQYPSTTPFSTACRFVPVLALLVVPCSRSLANAPNIQQTKIGSPIWKPVDFQLFSAPATPFDQEFGQVYNTLLPYDFPLAPVYTPHAPPYDTELSAGMIASGYVSQSVFTPSAITLNPNGVYFAFMFVPDPGTTGSSRDFASGPVISNSLFPLATNIDVWLDGVLVDRAPGADSITPVRPNDAPFQGTSHLESLQVIWHPWDDDLTVGPIGSYEIRASLRDVGGSGWDIVAPFQVVPNRPGDYNGDGFVNAADYTVWANLRGQTGAGLAADGTGPAGIPDGLVDQLDYDFWKARYGNSYLDGGGSSALAEQSSLPAVPEPSLAALVVALATAALVSTQRRRRVPRPRLGAGMGSRRLDVAAPCRQ
jgi:uncharacterized protein YjbI with pentapeptide repeats